MGVLVSLVFQVCMRICVFHLFQIQFDHFHFHLTPRLVPDLILTVCLIFMWPGKPDYLFQPSKLTFCIAFQFLGPCSKKNSSKRSKKCSFSNLAYFSSKSGKKNYDIIWEFFPNGRPHPPFGNPRTPCVQSHTSKLTFCITFQILGSCSKKNSSKRSKKCSFSNLAYFSSKSGNRW